MEGISPSLRLGRENKNGLRKNGTVRYKRRGKERGTKKTATYLNKDIVIMRIVRIRSSLEHATKIVFERHRD